MACGALLTSCSAERHPTSTAPPGGPTPGETATPIKHVIIIVGENRSFDHLFATYVPPNPVEHVLNLLSKQIINADGSPGASFRGRAPIQAHFRAQRRPNSSAAQELTTKALYTLLPPPDVNASARCLLMPPFSAFPAAIQACRPRISFYSAPAARI